MRYLNFKLVRIRSDLTESTLRLSPLHDRVHVRYSSDSPSFRSKSAMITSLSRYNANYLLYVGIVVMLVLFRSRCSVSAGLGVTLHQQPVLGTAMNYCIACRLQVGIV